MTLRDDILRRCGWFFVVMCLLFVGVLARIGWIQYAEGDRWLELKRKSYTQTETATRGSIFAADGRLLVSSVPEYRQVNLDLKAAFLHEKIKWTSDKDSIERFYVYVDSIAHCLAIGIGKKTEKEYRRWLVQEYEESKKSQKKSHRIQLAPKLSYTGWKELNRVSLFRKHKSVQSGLQHTTGYKRRASYDSLAKALLGGVYGENGKGHSGIEQRYNKELTGTNGYSVVQTIGRDGVPVVAQDPVAGADVTLTLDVDMQYFAERALKRRMQELSAEEGCAVVMETQTGKVRAIANFTRTRNGAYADSINYARTIMFEPGSVFKVASMLIALEDGYVQPDDIIDTGNGRRTYHYANRKERVMTDHGMAYGKITASEVIQRSSNVGMSDIIWKYYRNDAERYYDKVLALNLRKKLDFGIDVDTNNYIPRINRPNMKKDPTTLPWLSIGYESMIPPIYTLMFYNAIANKGVMMKPMFVERISRSGAESQTFEPVVLDSAICSQGTLDKLIPMMESVVYGPHGTARNTVKSTLFRVAGKTGTSYMKANNFHQASFCGFFPTDKPMYSCIVVIRKHGNLGGGGASGPVFREIAEQIYLLDKRKNPPLDLAKLPVQALPEAKSGNGESLKIVFDGLNRPLPSGRQAEWKVTTAGRVPNVVGMGAKDAVFLLENNGLRVSLNGSGKVASQSVDPETAINKGQTVYLELQ